MIGLSRWIFLASIVAAGVGLLTLSGMVFKTKLNWAKKVHGYERQLVQLDTEIGTLKLGVPENHQRVYSPDDPKLNPVADADAPQIGLRLVTDGVLWWTRQRGRQWIGAASKVDAATGAATIVIDDTFRPHQIGDKSFLYIFEANDKAAGGKYLGEFRVTAVAQDDTNNSIDIVPTDPLSAKELDDLAKSGTPTNKWQIYEKLPIDRYSTFANADDAMNSLLPDSVKKEYLRHGKDSENTDPPEHVVNGKYQRPLYDFMTLFRELRAKRPILADKLFARSNDAAAIEAALKLLVDPPPPAEPTSGRIVERAKEITKLEEEKKTAMTDLDTATKERAKIEEEVAALRKEVDDLVEKNKALAAEIIKYQLDAMSRVTSATAGAR